MLYIKDQRKQLIYTLTQARRYIFLKAKNPLRWDGLTVYFSHDSVKHSKPTDSSSLQQKKFVFLLQHLKSLKACIFKSNLFWHFALCWIYSHSKRMLCQVPAISYYGLKKKEAYHSIWAAGLIHHWWENNIGWATYISNHSWQLSILAATNEFQVSLETMISSRLWKAHAVISLFIKQLKIPQNFPSLDRPKENKNS